MKYLWLLLLLLTACNTVENDRLQPVEDSFEGWVNRQQAWLKANSEKIKIKHTFIYNNKTEEKPDSAGKLIQMLSVFAEAEPDKFLASQPYSKVSKDTMLNGQTIYVTTILAENSGKAGVKLIKVLHRKQQELFTDLIEIEIEAVVKNMLYEQRQRYLVTTSEGKINFLLLQSRQDVVFNPENSLEHRFTIQPMPKNF